MKNEASKINPGWEKVDDHYRKAIKLDFPPDAGFIYHQKNGMGFGYVPPIVSAWWSDSGFLSDDFVIVGDQASSQYLLAGALTAHRSMTHFNVVRAGGLFDSIVMEQRDVREHEEPEKTIILKGNDWRELLLEYAARLAECNMIPEIDSSSNITGYCTWYYYYKNVTEADFLENLSAVMEKRNSCYPVQIVQIDDGYQAHQGDWLEPHATWGRKLSEIAQKITASGMTAGIWLMPYQASTASRIFQEHPDWFVKDDDGNPRLVRGWSPEPDHLWGCLDMTNPDVVNHITGVFRTFRSWGFRYFKMDGMSFAMMRGKRFDPNATPVSAMRTGLVAIRNALPDCILLGCSAPFMPLLGNVDMCRIGCDTEEHTSRIEQSYRQFCGRWWMVDKLFRADPDVIIARQEHGDQSAGASRISVIGGILTGVSMTSDHLGKIVQERLELLGIAAKIRLRNPRPLIWHYDTPLRCWQGTINGGYAVAIVNDTDQPAEYLLAELGLGTSAEELLHPLGNVSGKISVPSHDAVLLKK